MIKLDVSKLLKTTQDTLAKHSPEILTGIGISGMVTATVLAVKSTPKALTLIEEEKNRQNAEIAKKYASSGSDNYPQLDKIKATDAIKVTWKCYIPSVVTTIVSISCLIGASSVNARRNTVLATAYKLSESAFTEYRDKVIETVGEKKEKTIREKVHKSNVENNPVNNNVVIVTGKGDTLCYDHTSGRYFKSDIEKIKKAINELNAKMLGFNYISQNDFYDALGLSRTNLGDKLGWNIDNGLIELDFSSQLTEDGVPCIVIDYRVPPKYNFDRFL